MSGARIRVLHVLGTAKPGGVETFVSGAARAIDRERFDVSVCVVGSDGPVADQMRAAGTRVDVLGAPGRLHPAASWRLLRRIRRDPPDILHVSVGGRLLHALLGMAHPSAATIVHLHGFPSEGEEQEATNSTIRKPWSRLPERLLCCSRAVAERWGELLPELRDRMAVLQHGIDTERFRSEPEQRAAVRAELGFGAGDVVAAFVGRFVPQKGIEHLVAVAGRVAAEFRQFRLLTIGDGPQAGQLQTLASQIGRERVVHLGERTDVERWLPACDILVLTSNWEPFGIAGFAVDGVGEAVLNGETGLLVSAGDRDALGGAVLRLARDRALRQRMGTAGRRRAEEEFGLDRMARRLEQEYEGGLLRSAAGLERTR
jgi:glycosyltransferase involved in cell wall biosynthesis